MEWEGGVCWSIGVGVVCLGLLVIIIYYSLELIDSYK